ncbi:hypothetical protein E3T43_07370 [Cryobacterium sp. Hh7]|uniref:hypothetical protein n=1 Tax=Cryobacterium sp. Hh7 TaxID=1259159 RepID=UPI00106D7105|nr:hypothetical protein [Cryobacterium sp. Hh7]TFD58057.1 hypothetical protein E3T43_07370 [Cryobacterium sp. Hh7]
MSNAELKAEARQLADYYGATDAGPLLLKLVTALEAAESPTSQMLTEDGRSTVVALGDYLFAHHPTAEPDIAKAALATIKALEAESPTTVEWADRDDITGHVTVWHMQKWLENAHPKDYPGCTIVSRNVSPWITVQA